MYLLNIKSLKMIFNKDQILCECDIFVYMNSSICVMPYNLF